MFTVATRNFRAAADPQAAARTSLSKQETYGLLRFHAGELNAWFFSQWERAQIVLGLGLMGAVVAGMRSSRWALIAAAALLLVTLIEHFFLSPEIARLGRELDFSAGPSPERARFGRLHGAYSSLELAKLAVLVLLSGRLILRSKE